jgi:transmembrane 9 superfamily member 2/4
MQLHHRRAVPHCQHLAFCALILLSPAYACMQNQEFVRPGFELGYKQDGKYFIYNHLVFNILVSLTHGEYTAAKEQGKAMAALEIGNRRHLKSSPAARWRDAAASQEGQVNKEVLPSVSRRELKGEVNSSEPYYMVVGFEVSPCSIQREAGKAIDNIICGVDGGDVPPMEIKVGAKIVYTYDVYWQESNIKWASRWDAYLRMPGGKVGRPGRSFTLLLSRGL